MVTLSRSLLYLKQAVVNLQGENKDIVSGVSTVMQCCEDLKKVREDIEAYSKRIYLHSCRIAEKSGIFVSMPQTVRCQQHRSNPESSSVADHMKKSVAIPFLDYLISDISSIFYTHSKQAASLQGLLPVNITVNTSIVDLNEATVFFSDDLPNPNILDEELCHWKTKWLAVKLQDRPETISDTLKQCCPTSLPNIFTLLKLFGTIPLSSCSCERSASALRRLNNYMRCTQSEERLSALALIYMHYEYDINIDHVCKLFFLKYHVKWKKQVYFFLNLL